MVQKFQRKRSSRLLCTNRTGQDGLHDGIVVCALLVGVESLDLATVEQRAEHAGLVHLHLGADGQHGVIPDPLSETC